MRDSNGAGSERSPFSAPDVSGRRLATGFFDVLAWVSMAVLCAYVMLVIANVIGRYVFNMPIHVVSDLGEILIPVSLALTFAVAAYRGAHLAIGFLGDWLGGRAAKWLNLFGRIVTIALMALITWKVAGYALDMHATGRTTVQFSLPLWPVWTFAALAFGLAVAGSLFARSTSKDTDVQ